MEHSVVILILLFSATVSKTEGRVDSDPIASTPAWHIGKLMYTVNTTEYLKPFHNVDDQSECREEKCRPEDCQYATSLTYDNQNEKQVKCSCHIACYSSGRCCLNFEEVCLAGQRSQWVADTFPYEENLIKLVSLQDQKNAMTEVEYFQKFTELRAQMICVGEVRVFFKPYGLHTIVNKCPACGPNSTCQSIKDLCEKRVLADLIQFVPVVVNRQLYENRFCAQCSGLRSLGSGADLDSVVYISHGLEITCSSSTDKEQLAQLLENGEQENILRSIQSGQCEAIMNIHQPHSIGPAISHDIVKKCDDRYRLLLENYDEIDLACRSYSAPVAYRHGLWSGYAMQNEHCGLCNVHPDDENRELWCLCLTGSDDADLYRCVYVDALRWDPQDNNLVPFFRIALDFRGNAKLEKLYFETCQGEEYLDVLNNQCMRPGCSKGTFKYGNKCLLQERFDFPLNSLNDDENTGMCISLDTDPLSIDSEPLISFFNLELNVHEPPFKIPKPRYSFSSFGCSSVDGLEISSPVNTNKTIFYERKINEDKDISVLKFFIEEGPKLMKKLRENYPVNQVLIQYEAHQRPCSPPSRQKIFSDFTIVWDHDSSLEYTEVNHALNANGKVYLDEMEMALSLNNVSVVVSIHRNSDIPGEWQVNKSALVCFQVNDSCPPDPTPSGDCSLPLGSKFEKYSKLQITWDSIFTLICACLSCVALIITLVLHLIMPEIMKSGGRAFVQLILSLLLAEICLAFGMFITREGLLCSGFAAVQHFAWLCTFVWTALLSSDLFKVLVLGENTAAISNWHNYQHLTYGIIGWGLPSAIVGCCLGLHFAGFFEYGGRLGCWISSPIQLALSFGVPVALVIVFNAVLYVRVVVTLHRQMEASAAVGRGYDLRTRFVLYSKMSTVVGFTWIFGFLANIEALSFMSYVFSMSAGLNGLLLSASFTFSPASILIMKQKWADFKSTRLDRSSRPADSTASTSRLTSQIKLSHGKPR